DQLAERVAQEKIDVVCITDHNVISAAIAAAAAGRLGGARGIGGGGIRTQAGEGAGVFLAGGGPYVVPGAQGIGRGGRQGGPGSLAHAYEAARGSLGAAADQLCEDGMADIVEVFNAKIADQSLNAMAADLAARRGLPGGAGSDAHDPAGVGAAYLEMPDFDGPAAFLTSLRSAHVVGEYRPHASRVPRP